VLALLHGPQRERDREAARDEDERVRRAEEEAEVARGLVKSLVIEAAVDGVAEEEAREEQHLGAEEQPHAEANGLGLLVLRVEVVRERGLARARRVVMVGIR